jgi:hypothetical protein
MCLKFKEKITSPYALVSLIDDDFGITFELFLFASNIKREVRVILDSFLSILRRFEERKVHNMLSLMLDPRFTSLCLVSLFVC